VSTKIFSHQEAVDYLARALPSWSVNPRGHLHKKFSFENFTDALAFTNRVGAVAEDQNHHPDLTVGWGFCSIEIWTHEPLGITDKDFRLAQTIETL
jgi:4a-hydroxytetrahydrobiopterin dehydratase